MIAYSGRGVGPGFGGVLAGSHLCEIAALAASPMRVETRCKRVPDGAGGLVETSTRFPIWFDPQAAGGTPMCAALRMAGDLLADWCREHPHGFPPTVLHVTDGEATDGSPTEVEAAAAYLTTQRTEDGEVLLFNLHVSGAAGERLRFPATEPLRLSQHARLLFRISSPMPEEFRRHAAGEGLAIDGTSRGYVYNGRLDDVVAFFAIGTRLRRGGGQWVKARAGNGTGLPAWLQPELASPDTARRRRSMPRRRSHPPDRSRRRSQSVAWPGLASWPGRPWWRRRRCSCCCCCPAGRPGCPRTVPRPD